MSNAFNKEERVAFETLLEGFQDALVMSGQVSTYRTDATMMERAGNTIWRPMPYIAQSHDGTDATANFDDSTQLAVPATLGFEKHSTALMTAKELNDALQENRLGQAAKQKLASDINVALMNIAALQGTIVVKRTAAAAGYDDAAQIEAAMNEVGVPMHDRTWGISTRDYNGLAKDLANRATMTGKPTDAYERGFVGRIASFDTFKLDYAYRLPAAAGGSGLTMDTRAAALNYWVPKATSVAATGETGNVDNRYQTITVSSTTSVAAGDAFTVAGNNAVHHITKGDTGQLKTHRVISVPSSTTLVISPPIISAQGATDAELQYQNVVVSGSGSATAAIVFLNTVTAYANPFWFKDAIEILPGRYEIPTNAGVAVMRGSTDQGVELTMQKFLDINTMKTKFRWDVRFGVCNKQPQQSGVILFAQT